MPDLREVELRIAVAEGVLSRTEAEALSEEARHKNQSPLALLVARGRLTDDSLQSLHAQALNDPAVRAAGHEASASTYTMQVAPRVSDEPVFPVAAWDRYTSVRFLGQGGMGMVFLATDARLRREVAIKFVRGDDAEHVGRLISEARNQAKVTHERICKVYEVDEVEGKVYIAMQYIAGEQLGQLAGELTLEQKVMLVRGAAEGIHEAHRKGIIHRDIKPSNIMVERTDDGEIRPYVMDFGLARSAQEAGTTQSGTLLGTPRYMAPEQAHGAAAKLDRRADVYSLGATLYHLITGQPPIAGDTVAEVIHNLVATEPRAPRAIDPSIPIDLEAILVKCLEKDRSARYDSARALADDLGRFMNGDPVLARPAGAWYRTRKRIAKHRRLVIAGAVALVLVLVAVGWGIKTRVQAAERERLARRFTEMVERIDAVARYSALSPRHDLRRDRIAIRASMDDIAHEIDRAGAAAAGPGHYALGRGYLALGDDARAQQELDVAWNAEFHEPQVAYALALALGHLYQQNLLAAERIDDQEVREVRKREIERLYRNPALGYLAYLGASNGAADVPSPEYLAALVAYYEGNLEQALRHVDALGGAASWLYEVPALRGDILLARALARRNDGKNELARSDFDAGRTAYAAAAAVGESVPEVYTSIANLEYVAMRVELYSQGDVMPPCDRARAAIAQALEVQPDHYEALTLRARIHRGLAEYQTNHGQNADELLAAALADAQRAVLVSPDRPQAREEMADIYSYWGGVRQDRNQDPSEQLRRAVAIAESILPQDRDAPYYYNLGLIFSVWADYEVQTGADGQDNRGKAIAAYTSALQIDRKLNRAWIGLATGLLKRAQQPHARDPDGDLRQAIGALDRAKSIDPDHYVSYFYRGRVQHAMAQRARVRGLDPEPDLARAVGALRRAIEINDKTPELYNGLGVVRIDQAKAAWDRGADPEPALDQAREAFQHVIKKAPDHAFGFGNLGETLAQRAWFERARGEDPSVSVAEAASALDQAIAMMPNTPTFWADRAMAYAVLAAYELDHGRDPQASLDEASRATASALDNAPGDVQSLRYRGETEGIRARFLARQGLHKADFAAAAQAFQKALDLEPDNPDTKLAFGHFCRTWAIALREGGEDPGPALVRGLALANDVLARHPAWPDALILRAGLALVQAQSSTGAANRRAQARRAVQDFTAALASHPALARLWEPQQAAAAALR